MSYINEALKKAQKERNTQHARYRDLLGGRLEEKRLFIGKLFLYSLFSLALILVVLIFYPWIDSSMGGKEDAVPYRMPVKMEHFRNSDNFKVLYDKAGSLLKNGFLHDAEVIYEQLLDSDPGYVDAINNLGIIHIRDKDYPQAERYFHKAIRLNPIFAEPYYNLACLNVIRGENEKGLFYLKKAVSLNNEVKEWALNDPDLAGLGNSPEFVAITAK